MSASQWYVMACGDRRFLLIVAAFVGFRFVWLVCLLKKKNLYLADSLHLISGIVSLFDNMTSAHLKSNTYINLRVYFITSSSLTIYNCCLEIKFLWQIGHNKPPFYILFIALSYKFRKEVTKEKKICLGYCWPWYLLHSWLQTGMSIFRKSRDIRSA